MNWRFAILLSIVLAGGCAGTNDDERYGIEEPPAGDTLFDPAAANDPIVEEGEGIEPSFAEVDANGDGRISEEEAENYEAVGAYFKYVDEDNDGYLSDVEFMDLKE